MRLVKCEIEIIYEYMNILSYIQMSILISSKITKEYLIYIKLLYNNSSTVFNILDK